MENKNCSGKNRHKSTIRDIIGIIAIIGTISSVTLVYGKLQWNVNVLADESKKIVNKVIETNKKDAKQDISIAKIQTQLEILTKGQEKISELILKIAVKVGAK